MNATRAPLRENAAEDSSPVAAVICVRLPPPIVCTYVLRSPPVLVVNVTCVPAGEIATLHGSIDSRLIPGTAVGVTGVMPLIATLHTPLSVNATVDVRAGGV